MDSVQFPIFPLSHLSLADFSCDYSSVFLSLYFSCDWSNILKMYQIFFFFNVPYFSICYFKQARIDSGESEVVVTSSFQDQLLVGKSQHQRNMSQLVLGRVTVKALEKYSDAYTCKISENTTDSSQNKQTKCALQIKHNLQLLMTPPSGSPLKSNSMSIYFPWKEK